MPTEKPRPERPADLGKKARNDLLYLARTERSMGNNLLASRIEEAVESLDAFRSFSIHLAEQIADLQERLGKPTKQWTGGTFRELEVAMDEAADLARREFLRTVSTSALRDAREKADLWGEVGLADLFASELERRA